VLFQKTGLELFNMRDDWRPSINKSRFS